MTRFAPVYRALGMVIMLFGLTMLAPLILSYVVDDGAQTAYDEAFGLTMLSGLFLWYRYRRCKRELAIRDGFLMVVLVWTVLPAFAALPYMLHLGLTHTDAYFEAVSGLTATGATVLSGLDTLPMSINLWRHLTMWFGGMGLIVLAVAILPLLGIGGRQMLLAEVPGPMKDARMTPRIAETAKGLWLVYIGITVLCILAYRWAGMGWFDAVCHAFAALSLGGFSTHDASVGYFNSVPIEVVLSFFMLLAAMNFATHFLAIRDRNIRHYIRDSEAKSMLALIAIMAVTPWRDVVPGKSPFVELFVLAVKGHFQGIVLPYTFHVTASHLGDAVLGSIAVHHGHIVSPLVVQDAGREYGEGGLAYSSLLAGKCDK